MLMARTPNTAGADNSSAHVSGLMVPAARARGTFYDDTLTAGPLPWGMMIGRAATGLSRLDEHVRAHTSAADERPRQGHGDPCAAAPAGGPATQSGQARVHAERPHAAGRAPAPPSHPEAAAAPPADASGHYPALAPRAAEPTQRRDLRAEATRTPAHRTLHPRPGPAPRPREPLVGLQEDPEVSSSAATVSPVRVVVAAIVCTMTSWLVSGRSRQFIEIWENSRCSILFHLEVPGQCRCLSAELPRD